MSEILLSALNILLMGSLSWLKLGVGAYFHDWRKHVNALYCSGHAFLGNNCNDSNHTNAKANSSPGRSA